MRKKISGSRTKQTVSHKNLPKGNRPSIRNRQASEEESVGEDYGREGTPAFGGNVEVA